MKIIKLKLENFRGIKSAEFDMDSDYVTIAGANGTGKTTVANAISWILTDKPATGEKDFSPKTEGTHNLNHIVEMQVQDKEKGLATYRKDFHEVWKKKRGSKSPEFSGHETTYEINGVPVSKKEFDQAMETLTGGDPKYVLMLSRAGYFAEEMKMDERRKVLFDVCGDVTDDEVIEAAGLQELREILIIPGTEGRRYSPEEYLQIAKGKRKETNRKLDEIPARIDELTGQLPNEAPDESEKRREEIKSLEEEKKAILSTPAENKVAALRAAEGGLRVEMEKAKETYLKEANEQNRAIMERIGAMQKELSETNTAVYMADSEAEKLKLTLKRLKEKRESLLARFDSLKEQKWDPNKELCPYCGQGLPLDKINVLRHNFLEGLSNEKRRINEEGKECSKQVLTDMQEKIRAKEEERRALAEKVVQIKSGIEETQKLTAEVAPFETTQKYADIKAHQEEIAEKLRKAEDADDTIKDTSEIDARLKALREQEAAVNAAEGIKARIKELEKEQKNLGGELDRLDNHINLIERFYREKVSMVTKKIDDKFKTIKFLLFKDQINGGLKEVCEPLIPDRDGNLIEYKSANTAAQVNAGLEIIQVLSEHFNVHLPIIIDRSESVTELRPMPDHQMIRLMVSDKNKELAVTLG